jgi:hypothetical protein
MVCASVKRAGRLGQAATEDGATPVLVGRGQDRIGPDSVRVAGRQRHHHLLRGRQPRGAGYLLRAFQDPGAAALVAVQHLGRREHARLHEQPGGADQGVGGQVGGDVVAVTVADLGVRSRVPAEADHRQVQEHGGAVVPGQRGGGQRGVVDVGEVGPVGVEVGDAGPARDGGLDPAGRRAHADAQAVVLAHDQQRERQALVRAVPGGVERAHRGGVVDRGIAQAGHHDRVGGPAAGGAQPGGAALREGEPDRARQMRGDRGGLRDDVKVGAAEHLVPPARDRLGSRRDQPEQHVAHAVPGRGGVGGTHLVERPDR